MNNTHSFAAISIDGCEQNNLKSISLSIPLNAITVITGVSGSGKSSLAFDTLHAEGQRRYFECLAPQERKHLRQLPRAQVKRITGLGPTIAVKQDRIYSHHRATIATHSKIYEFLCLLFSQVGEQHSPQTGKKLERFHKEEMVETLLQRYEIGTRLQLIAPIKVENCLLVGVLQELMANGFTRFSIQGEEIDPQSLPIFSEDFITLDVGIDHIVIKDGIRDRLAQSIETTLRLSKGVLKLTEGRDGPSYYFSEYYWCADTDHKFSPLSPSEFKFTSKGACAQCDGRGGDHVVQLPLEISTEELEFITKLFTPTDKKKVHLQSDLKTLIQNDLNKRKSASNFFNTSYVQWQNCPACNGA